MGRRPDFEWLRLDARRTEALAWEPWLKGGARTRRRFARVLEADPMSDETASVSVWASAESCVGLLTLAEYACLKREIADSRAYENGRVELWVGDERRSSSWGFEAKQVFCRPGVQVSTPKRQLAHAVFEASRIPAAEANRRFDLLIAVATADARGAKLETCLIQLAAASQFACRCGGGSRAIHLFFRRAARSRLSERMSAV